MRLSTLIYWVDEVKYFDRLSNEVKYFDILSNEVKYFDILSNEVKYFDILSIFSQGEYTQYK